MSQLAANQAPAAQDLNSIKSGDWPHREFPLGPREKPTRRQVIIRQSVLNDIHSHGRSAPEIEVCGVLVGNVYQDAMGPFVYVEANIRGNYAPGRAAQVTFTAKTWEHIQDVLDREYPDMRILGWYHTHPGHGIFLSDMDLFIHKNFFSLPWHTAFVFDPKAGEEGLFAWRSGNMAVESFVVKKDVAADAEPVAKKIGEFPTPQHPLAPTTLGAAAMPASLVEISARLQALEQRQRWVTAGLALLAMLAVAWPLALAAYSAMRASETPLEPTPPAAAVAAPREAPSADQRSPITTDLRKGLAGRD